MVWTVVIPETNTMYVLGAIVVPEATVGAAWRVIKVVSIALIAVFTCECWVAWGTVPELVASPATGLVNESIAVGYVIIYLS